MDTKRGLFIVFEGIDGCGKSTQVWNFARHLTNLSKYHHVLLTRNPYKSREIRAILRLTESAQTRAELLAKLFIQDRIEHVNDLVLPHINKGHHVVCDRYKLSTLAYQSAQGLPIQKLIDLHIGLPVPDITFIIDTPTEIARQRMNLDNVRDKNKEHKFEADINFQNQVRKNYLLAKNHLSEEHIKIIDGTKSINEIESQVKSEFDSLMLRL
ncbi:dTMP kinase [Candidatus Pacearchaeota archaeon]|nr:dTMP kinase [Candidatus Pacearchaeota archaeon]